MIKEDILQLLEELRDRSLKDDVEHQDKLSKAANAGYRIALLTVKAHLKNLP